MWASGAHDSQEITTKQSKTELKVHIRPSSQPLSYSSLGLDRNKAYNDFKNRTSGMALFLSSHINV